jgi:hypothetical protein
MNRATNNWKVSKSKAKIYNGTFTGTLAANVLLAGLILV